MSFAAVGDHLKDVLITVGEPGQRLYEDALLLDLDLGRGVREDGDVVVALLGVEVVVGDKDEV